MHDEHQKDDKDTCMACSCPCDMHKEHTHDDEHHAKKCMACECPCDEHKEHNH